jgi:hypothetical protein
LSNGTVWGFYEKLAHGMSIHLWTTKKWCLCFSIKIGLRMPYDRHSSRTGGIALLNYLRNICIYGLTIRQWTLGQGEAEK